VAAKVKAAAMTSGRQRTTRNNFYSTSRWLISRGDFSKQGFGKDRKHQAETIIRLNVLALCTADLNFASPRSYFFSPKQIFLL
jgi:hypothetical protein